MLFSIRSALGCTHQRQKFGDLRGGVAPPEMAGAVMPCADTRCSPRVEMKGVDGKPLAVKRVQTLKGWKWVAR